MKSSITRKRALKFMTLGSVSTILAPAFFATSFAKTNTSGGYQSFNEIFNAVYPFSLAELPYGYDALEPAIDAKTMEIHHGRHHQGYINNLNNALEDHPRLQGMTLAELVEGINELPSNVRRPFVITGAGI